MKYKGTALTIDNYRGILLNDGFDEDLLDEVRSAIFDGIDVEEYLVNTTDPYYLQQVRVGKKQGVPSWITVLPNGDLIRRARALYKKGVNLEPVSAYTNSRLMSEDYYSVLLDWLEAGSVLPDVPLHEVPAEMLPFLSWAVLRGLDASDIVLKPWMNTVYAANALRLRHQGTDITRLLDERWRTDVVEFLPNIVSHKRFNDAFEAMTSSTDIETAQVLGAMLRFKFPINNIPNIREYAGFQLDWILKAWEDNLDYSTMLDPLLGARDLHNKYTELVKSKSRKLTVRL